MAEHVIHSRISRHVEERHLLPPNMVGFRPSLSTQEVIPLIKRQIVDVLTRNVRGILALDLAKAFDRVKHKHVPDSVTRLNLDERFFVRQLFPQGSQGQDQLGLDQVGRIRVGSPRHAAGCGVNPTALQHRHERPIAPTRPNRGVNVNHALSADDITVCCGGGSDAVVERALQDALHVTEEFLEGTRLVLWPTKSELLLYWPDRKGRKFDTTLDQVPIELGTKTGQCTQRVDSLKVLGLVLNAKDSNAQTIARLSATMENMLRLVWRVTSRRGDFREANLLRIYHAFLMSHINHEASAGRRRRTRSTHSSGRALNEY
ncbi:uncharacterized protein [Dermacentor andersoni]|uniref:uncharacterized protein n=1 Tax=Dermacentor andersoni TaxID=34620 RepID=UPI003B3B0E9B